MVRVLAIPIILFWGLLAISTNTFLPQVEVVAEELAGPQVPHVLEIIDGGKDIRVRA